MQQVKTASVTSSMAINNVKESVKYTVVYDWGSDYPTDVTVPKDDTKYENIEKAKEAVKIRNMMRTQLLQLRRMTKTVRGHLAVGLQQ